LIEDLERKEGPSSCLSPQWVKDDWGYLRGVRSGLEVLELDRSGNDDRCKV
jgi:hypothetical protein